MIVEQIEGLQTQEKYDTSLLLGLKHQLRQVDQAQADKIYVQTKLTALEEDEKPTHYFYKNLKKRESKANFTEVYTDNLKSETSKEPRIILDKATSFYKDLYSADTTVLESRQSELIDLIDKQLNFEQKRELDQNITKEDLHNSLRETENTKSPGKDGLPYEFYKTFWNTIGNDFYELTNAIFDSGRLTESQKVALISLLAKDGDKKDLDNWRPLSLLCTDYKIIAKTIATKIKATLPSLINEDQSCSVPGRSIHNNLMLTRDILSYSHQKKLKGYIVTVDQAKAFDMVHRGLVFKILKKMNMGNNIIKWVKILYTDTKSALYLNGYIGEIFRTSRGVRQGCPLSAILYVIYSELLGQLIRSSKKLKGFKLPGTKEEALVSQYADDTSFFLHFTSNLNYLFSLLKLYEELTGSRIKNSKTKGLLLHCDPPQSDFPIEWRNSEGLKILGITFFDDYIQTLNFNWTRVLTTLQNHFEDTKSRKLSFRGKVLNINTLGLANFWYLASIYTYPHYMIKTVDKLIFDYLWDYKSYYPIKRDTLYLPKEAGGLGIFQPWKRAVAIKTKYVKQITDPLYKVKWVYLARYYTGFQLAPLDESWKFLRSNLLPKPDSDIYPMHYQDMILFTKTLTIKDTKWISSYLYEKIVTQNIHEPVATQDWSRIRPRPYDWPALWQLLHFSYSSAKKQQLMYKVLHRALPIKNIMAHWHGRGNTDTRCNFCKDAGKSATETFIHLFYDCEQAYDLWTRAKPALSALLNTSTTHCYNLTFGIFRTPATRPVKKLVITLIQSILYYIWLARNSHTMDNTAIDHALSFEKVKKDFEYDIKTLFKKFGTNLLKFRHTFCDNKLITIDRNHQVKVLWPQT